MRAQMKAQAVAKRELHGTALENVRRAHAKEIELLLADKGSTAAEAALHKARLERARAAFRDEHAELEHALAQRAVDANAAKRAHRAALDAAAAEHATEGAAAGRTWEFKTGFNVQWTPAKEE